MDIDVLHLTKAKTIINVFYNLATDKIAFALIQKNKRIYGADNAKIDWHYHHFTDPYQYINCEPMTFVAFLQAVEDYFGE